MTRVTELDGLRGLAAAGIVAFHYSYPWPVFGRGVYAAQAAMECFFVLSGFLITSVILTRSDEPGFLKNFFVGRGLRIWPAYYLAVGCAAVVVWLRPTMGDLGALWKFLTFTQYTELYSGREPSVLTYALEPTWSLVAEEQFYLFWPAVVAFLGRRWVGPTAAMFVAAGVAWRSLGMSSQVLAGRCDEFAIGALLALSTRHPARHDPWLYAAAVVGSLAYLGLGLPAQGVAPFLLAGSALAPAVASAGFAGIIGLAVTYQGHPALSPLRWRWLAGLGTISYGVYLYHLGTQLVAVGVCRKLGLPKVVADLFLAPVFTLVVATASWRFVERPAMRLKSRLTADSARCKPGVVRLSPTTS